MRRILWMIIFIWMTTVTVYAAELDNTTIRLERQKSGTSPLPILIMSSTTTNLVENNLKIKVASGWVVASNVIVSTANLPSGVVAWPGIANSNSVVGQIIDFPSNDLTVGQLYGFYIISGIGNNPSSLNNTWEVSTNLDSKFVNVQSINNDQVTVTGQVGAKATDFQLEITADKNTALSVDDEITYSINYGSYLLNYTKPLVITASWSRGTVAGSPTPSVDIVDYVDGSAGSGYGGVIPVVDLLNRRITWTINSFPANTINESVSFKLKVNNSYTGSSNVGFEVMAFLEGANVVTVDKVLGQIVETAIIPSLTPTLSPTNIPNTGGSPTVAIVNPTLTPMPISVPKIEKIKMVFISDSAAIIEISTNQLPDTLTINYGEQLNRLTKSVISLNRTKEDRIKLDGLKPNTDIYFQIKLKSNSATVVNSGIYTFKTAKKSTSPLVDQNSLIVSIGNNIVLDAASEKNATNSVIMIPNENYALRVNFVQPELIKTVKVNVLNTQVLGLMTVYGAEPNSVSVDLNEIVNGGFVGHLKSPNEEGYYEIVLVVEDNNGNLVEQNVGLMRIISPLVVVDDKSISIENAKLTLFRYNNKYNIYEVMTANSYGISNPLFSEPNGEVRVALPKGKYQVEVKAIGYLTKNVEFEIGMGADEKLPKVELAREAYSIGNMVAYFGEITKDTLNYSIVFLQNVVASNRFYNLLNLITGILAGIVIVEFVNKKLNKYVSQFRKLFENRGKWLYGQIIDEKTLNSIRGAEVYLMDGKSNKVLSKGKTDFLGNFKIKLQIASSYKVVVTKNGYETSPMLDYSKEGLLYNDIIVKLENLVSESEKVELFLFKITGKFTKFVMTLLLGVVVMYQIYYSINLGMVYTWLMAILSILSLMLWLKI